MDFDTEKFAQEFECVGGDSMITIRDKQTLEEHTMKIEDFYRWMHMENS
jgi:hypothetical protein